MLLALPVALAIAIADDLFLQHQRLSHDQRVENIVRAVTLMRAQLRAFQQSMEGRDALRALRLKTATATISLARARDLVEAATGATYIGRGLTRIAFLVSPPHSPRFVLKFALFGRGYQDNETEVALWRWAQAHQDTDPDAQILAQYLTPIRLMAEDRSWLVMDWVDIYPPDRWNTDEHDAGVLKQISDIGVFDQFHLNLGVHDGELRVLDYAELSYDLTDMLRDMHLLPGSEDDR